MGLDDEIIKACKGIVNRKIKNAAETRRALIDNYLQSAVEILSGYRKKLCLQGITATGDYITGGYEVTYCGESINGAITIMDTDCEKTGDKPGAGALISVTCKAHSCVTRSFYKEKIPETDLEEFIKYATRGPTLNDRWRRMAGYYHGEF